ncbi:MAG: hypothetical protein HZA54_08745 [Planctomycetes bacterium]|nr:hypothetical protein [Planctomycetota bacterium]
MFALIRRRESGKIQFGQLVGTAVAIAVGLGVAYWYMAKGGDKTTKDVLKSAEKVADKAADAAEKKVDDVNAGFDASRARRTEQRTGGLAK